jgi:hypothetical protein
VFSVRINVNEAVQNNSLSNDQRVWTTSLPRDRSKMAEDQT